MKLICLNTWGGRAGAERLLAFLASHRDADFVCLQEVWSAPYENLEGVPAGGSAIAHAKIMVYGKQEISALLGGHAAFFPPRLQSGMILALRDPPQVRDDNNDAEPSLVRLERETSPLSRPVFVQTRQIISASRTTVRASMTGELNARLAL